MLVARLQRQHSPNQRHAPARLCFRRQRNNRHLRPVARNQARRESAVREHYNQFHMQFARSVANKFRDGFCDFQFFLRRRPWKFLNAAFRRLDNPRHHAHRFHGILPACRFRGQHHCIRPVEDRIRHVRRFRARRTRIFRHRFQHLRRGNHRPAKFPRTLNNLFLHHRHSLRAHLHAQIAARHHHSVGNPQNRFEIFDRLGLLQLRNHRRLFFRISNQLFRERHIFRSPHKTHRDVIRSRRQCKFQIGFVLRRKRRHPQLHARQIDPLVFSERPAVHHLANHFESLNLLHAKFD